MASSLSDKFQVCGICGKCCRGVVFATFAVQTGNEIPLGAVLAGLEFCADGFTPHTILPGPAPELFIHGWVSLVSFLVASFVSSMLMLSCSFYLLMAPLFVHGFTMLFPIVVPTLDAVYDIDMSYLFLIF